MGTKPMIKLRAGRVWDLPRLRTLWREGFPHSVSDEYFFEHCFAPDHVESSLVLLEDGMIQSAVYFLPTFWYDEKKDSYAPAPCLVGLTTDQHHRHQRYASWLVETACDFMVEKGAGAVWALLPNDELELFFSMQGFWTMEQKEHFNVAHQQLPHASGKIMRAEPEEYDQVRERLLAGSSHIVSGALVTAIQRDLAERAEGGMFLMHIDGIDMCAIVQKEEDTVLIQELLCPEEKRLEALALLSTEVSGAQYSMHEKQQPCGMLRMMNAYNEKLEHPQGYLGCGSLL